MTDQVESRKRGRDEITNPGDVLDLDKKDGKREFKWANLEYHMTYKGWIALELLKAAVLATFPHSSILAYSMVHEESDGENPYKHTHFYFKLDKKSERRGARLMDIDGVHPHCRKVSSHSHRMTLVNKYHFKQGTPVQHGIEDLKSPGEREQSRWCEIRDKAVTGDLKVVLADHPGEFMRCARAIRDIALHRGAEPPTFPPLKSGKFYWFYGVPNTGKSTLAYKICKDTYPDEDPYVMPASLKFVQGYQYQKAFIIEEASPESCHGRATFYKTLLDLFPTQVDVKNSYQVIRPELVIVTSNFHPRECFSVIDSDAILARVNLGLCTKVYAPKKQLDDQHLAEVKKSEGVVFQ